MTNNKSVIVVGGGPAGMMAALSAGMCNAEVTLLEKNPVLGKKLLLTGNGRGNFTNAIDIALCEEYFSHGGSFLRNAFKEFSNRDLMRFLKKNGMDYKVEKDNRVFPSSDRSESILNVLKKRLKEEQIDVLYNTTVCGLKVSNGNLQGVYLDGKRFLPCCCAILATGGVSYPHTGSDGEGLRMASQLGHKIVDLCPGLAALEIRQDYIKSLEGIAIKDAIITFYGGAKKVISRRGDFLFTKNGISGPIVLSCSSRISKWFKELKNVNAKIDFLPDVTKDELSGQLVRERDLSSAKSVRNILSDILPKRLIITAMRMNNIDTDKKISFMTRIERNILINFLKEMTIDIAGPEPIEKAMVTQGGISLKEVYPKTMGSCLVKGLYFAGEILDIDADTGGFNLQAAFSTGYCAGKHAGMQAVGRPCI